MHFVYAHNHISDLLLSVISIYYDAVRHAGPAWHDFIGKNNYSISFTSIQGFGIFTRIYTM